MIFFSYIILFFLISLPFLLGLGLHYSVRQRRERVVSDLQNTDYQCISGIDTTRYPVSPPLKSTFYYGISDVILSDTKVWIFIYWSFFGVKCYHIALFFDFETLPDSRKPKINKTKMRLIYKGEKLLEGDIYCQLDFYKKNINVQDLVIKYNIPHENDYQGQ